MPCHFTRLQWSTRELEKSSHLGRFAGRQDLRHYVIHPQLLSNDAGSGPVVTRHHVALQQKIVFKEERKKVSSAEPE